MYLIYLALTKLLGTLILGVLNQFHKTTLIRSKASNFTNNTLDKNSALGSSLIYKNIISLQETHNTLHKYILFSWKKKRFKDFKHDDKRF
jgi:hypothetical protein